MFIPVQTGYQPIIIFHLSLLYHVFDVYGSVNDIFTKMHCTTHPLVHPSQLVKV